MLKLSPSDFAYLYEECKLCYWLKIKHGVFQPSMPFPGVFSAINTRLQTPLIGKNLRDLNKDLPPGIVQSQEGWVESKAVPGTNVFIKGKYDLLVKQDDGSHVLIDLKISQPAEDKIDKYKTQLAAYKFALENPAQGKPIKVDRLGLLIFYPDIVEFSGGIAKFDFPPTWFEIPVEIDKFLSFAREVDELLSGPMPPEGEECKWCKYRHLGDQLSHIAKTETEDDIPF